MSEVLTKKSFPENYPTDATTILDTMSFTHGKTIKLVGSMSLRSQQYAGDYDAYEVVPPSSVASLVSRFQHIVKDLIGLPNAYIGDIKAGVIDEWKVGKEGLSGLRTKGVITAAEEKEAKKGLPEDIKFHIVRWTPREVLRGRKTLRDGRVYTLTEAFRSPSIIKLDVVGLVNNSRYTDFSVIYELHDPTGKTLNPVKKDVGASLRDDIEHYTKKGEHFKVLKRKFALAKLKGNTKELKRLQPILNGDLGRLYQVVSDIGTLLYLLENHKGSLSKMKFEIDQFRGRLANIYSLKGYLRAEPGILDKIGEALKGTKTQMRSRLRVLDEELRGILNK